MVGEDFWHQSTVYIIGGGPSLRGFDFSCLQGKGIILGVNDGAFYANADVLFSLDATFARRRWKEIQDFSGSVWLAMPPNHEVKIWPGAERVNMPYRGRGNYLSEDPEWIYGVNSGFGALNLAFLKQASEIVLLGFDLHPDNEGHLHFHKGYEWEPDVKRAKRHYQKWLRPFECAAEQLHRDGIRVINASLSSRIEVFEKCAPEELC